MIEIKYPHLERLSALYPNPHILLGHDIEWTVKEDGSNIGCYLDENDELQLRSRNMPKASEQFYTYFDLIGYRDQIEEMLFAARDYNDEFVVFGELLTKGKSPTRIETHENHDYRIFDIWSQKDGNFMSYNRVHQEAYHAHVPIVEMLLSSKSADIEHLYEIRDSLLEQTKERGKEGVVGKAFGTFNRLNPDKYVFFKEKNDLPQKIPRIAQDGKPQLPDLVDGDIYGAIEKARTDLGELFFDVKSAMPVVARYIAQEAKDHNCQPPKDFFRYYRERCDEIRAA